MISVKPSGTTKYDVVAFGTNAVDFLINVPEYPEYNSKVELTDYRQAAGGEAATTAVGLQRLGLRAAYAGRFGSDEAGQIGITSLTDEGVDLEFAETIEGAATQIAFIVIDERTGERTVIWKRDRVLSYSKVDAPISAAESCRVLHLTPHDTAACIEMAKAAKVSGALVSIDIDNVFPGVEDLLSHVDIFVSSAEFPSRLTGTSDVRQSLSIIRERFDSTLVCATLGDKGCLTLTDDGFLETPGFEVPGGCKDTTGAGDAFRAGLLFGILSGNSVERSAQMANAVAALKCRAIGARTALPSLNELEELLKKI